MVIKFTHPPKVKSCLRMFVCDSVSIASTDADTVTADITDLSPSHITAAAVSSSLSSVAVVKPCVSVCVSV